MVEMLVISDVLLQFDNSYCAGKYDEEMTVYDELMNSLW